MVCPVEQGQVTRDCVFAWGSSESQSHILPGTLRSLEMLGAMEPAMLAIHFNRCYRGSLWAGGRHSSRLGAQQCVRQPLLQGWRFPWGNRR